MGPSKKEPLQVFENPYPITPKTEPWNHRGAPAFRLGGAEGPSGSHEGTRADPLSGRDAMCEGHRSTRTHTHTPERAAGLKHVS